MALDPVQAVNSIISLGTLAGGAVLLIRAKSQNRKDTAEGDKAEADATAVVSAAALSLLGPFKEQLEDCQKEAASLRKELTTAHRQTAAVKRDNERLERKAERLDRQLNGALIEVAELRDINERYRELHGPLPA